MRSIHALDPGGSAADLHWDRDTTNVIHGATSARMRRAHDRAAIRRTPDPRKCAARADRPLAAWWSRTREAPGSRKSKETKEDTGQEERPSGPQLRSAQGAFGSRPTRRCARSCSARRARDERLPRILWDDTRRLRHELGTRHDAARRHPRALWRVEYDGPRSIQPRL